MRLAIRSFTILFLSFSCGFVGVAQSSVADHVPGVILVQLESGAGIAEVSENAGQLLPKGVRLKVVEQLSIPMQIHKLTFDGGTLDDRGLLSIIRSVQGVQVAQFDHYVEIRETIPDDPGFVGQWQYENTGQTGGAVDADIDMPEAWDTTTGGLTATGDTIVVCVIDDGIDHEHPDMVPNLWTNHAEIPGNGIDDDDNGFVDDVRGWDTGNNNDAVYDGGGHGTPVAGIVGAKGNNGDGVAGVNWDVKLMIVQGGGGVESEVLEAYSYPLTMRKMYNESNGAEGAFVVATNSSWGTDFGQPADAPLWCAFYDSLGVAGIINCGATINGDVNVDTEGDLPTACPSDYLISVTNTDHFDEKVGGAGYGSISIDLGAPGQNAYTVTNNSGYGGFGGTSGATPHVAGAVGLLYSIPCPSLMALAYDSPEVAAALIRDAILDGVDANSSLEGITVTGGRLNVANSMDILMENCGECPLPFVVQSQSPSLDELMVSWVLPSDAALPIFYYRPVGTTDWITVEQASSPLLLSDIEACAHYEYQFSVECTDGPLFSELQQLLSGGCCEEAGGIEAEEVDEVSAIVAWESVMAATGYDIRYRPLGGDWIELINPEDPFVSLFGLVPCTDYEVQIRTICADSLQAYSPSLLFTTAGCGACTDIDYCELSEINNSSEWISEVHIGEWVLTSGPGEGGYEDLTGIDTQITLVQGVVYDCELIPGFSGQQWDEYFKIYIDLDLDGEFDEETEEVFSSEEASSLSATGTIDIPFIADSGYTRMRVAMQYNAEPAPCENTSNFGEVEDYCVNIVSGPVGLDEQDGVMAVTVSPNPFDDRLSIQVEVAEGRSLRWALSDITGRAMHTGSLDSAGSRIDIDMSTATSGVYFFTLRDDAGRQFSRRVVKR